MLQAMRGRGTLLFYDMPVERSSSTDAEGSQDENRIATTYRRWFAARRGMRLAPADLLASALRQWRGRSTSADFPLAQFELASDHDPGRAQPAPILAARPVWGSWAAPGVGRSAFSWRGGKDICRIALRYFAMGGLQEDPLPDRIDALLRERLAGRALRLDGVTEIRCRALLGTVTRAAGSRPPGPDQAARLYARLHSASLPDEDLSPESHLFDARPAAPAQGMVSLP